MIATSSCKYVAAGVDDMAAKFSRLLAALVLEVLEAWKKVENQVWGLQYHPNCPVAIICDSLLIFIIKHKDTHESAGSACSGGFEFFCEL